MGKRGFYIKASRDLDWTPDLLFRQQSLVDSVIFETSLCMPPYKVEDTTGNREYREIKALYTRAGKGDIFGIRKNEKMEGLQIACSLSLSLFLCWMVWRTVYVSFGEALFCLLYY